MRTFLEKRAILFISPVFFHYHVTIIDKLEKVGAKVVFYPERQYGIFYLLFSLFGNKFLTSYKIKYYKRILKQISLMKFDYFFVIKGDGMPSFFINEIKKKNNGIICLMYQWDSLRNNDYRSLIPLFHKVFTFDPLDSKNLKINYLPLFFTDDILEISRNKQKEDIDILLVGTYLEERYKALLYFKEYAKVNHLIFKYILFTPFSFYLKLLFSGKLVAVQNVTFKALPYTKVNDLYARTKCIIDIPSKNQSGLSMRTIEAIGAKKKLISSNLQVLNESFYNEEQIKFISLSEIEIERSFILTPLSDNTLNDCDLHIENWLYKIFEKI